jgi:two-component system response regulator PhoP
MRILIVEDENTLRGQLVSKFRQKGFAVDEAADGEEALFYAREYPLDVAVVDIGLPKLSGIEVIKRLRTDGIEYPILILTARSHWQEKVEGLDAGADDYLAKPFHFEELHARVSALIRRSAGQSSPVIEIGQIHMDTRSQEVLVNQQRLDLTAFEYKLLLYLMLNRGKVVSKMELTEHLYDEDADRDSNVIEVFVGRLRKKLDPEGSLNPIETLRGRGYRFLTVD